MRSLTALLALTLPLLAACPQTNNSGSEASSPASGGTAQPVEPQPASQPGTGTDNPAEQAASKPVDHQAAAAAEPAAEAKPTEAKPAKDKPTAAKPTGKGPAKITLNKSSKKMKPVVFDHHAHQKRSKACKDCHHKALKGKATPACHACHTKPPKGDAPEPKKIFHKRCKGCHKDGGKGPTKCKACHKQ